MIKDVDIDRQCPASLIVYGIECDQFGYGNELTCLNYYPGVYCGHHPKVSELFTYNTFSIHLKYICSKTTTAKQRFSFDLCSLESQKVLT